MRELMPLVILTLAISPAGWAPLRPELNMREADRWAAGWVTTGIALFVGLGATIGRWMRWSIATSAGRWLE
jgi:hypothetical protein